MTLDLLPAFYRERDDGFLEALLAVVGEQFGLVEADLDRLYDDLFVETCDAWVVPYIGDLVGVTPGAPVESDAVLTRAAVANAVALRRRKGTAAVLEELARDVTGWPAVAVEMFRRLAVTQQLQHVAPERGGTLSLRDALALERLGGAFETAAHTPEVRRIGSGRGRYNVPSVAIMVWRDSVLARTWTDARPAGAGGTAFRFDALGVDRHLATRPRSELTVAHRATPLNVPGALTRRAMTASPGDYYGDGLSVAVRLDGDTQSVDGAEVVVCDLSGPDGSWSNAGRLTGHELGIDPQLGRLAFATAQAAPPQVSVVFTAPSDTGGSEADERPAPPAGEPVIPVRADGVGGAKKSVVAALSASGGVGTVEVRDNRTYIGTLSVDVPAGALLRLAGAPGTLPVLEVGPAFTATVGEHGVLTLRGLVVAGGPLIVRGRADRIELADCTLVPGARLDPDAEVTPPVEPSLVVAPDADWRTEVTLTNCITGPLSVPADGTTLSLTDSIVDGVDDGLGRAATAGAPGRIVPVLRSPAPLGVLSLPAGSTSLRLTLGGDDPRVIDLGAVPAGAAQAAAQLDAALAGSGARALEADDRVVLVGDGRPLSVATQPGSGLADGLGLTGETARTRAVAGGPADMTATGSITVTGHTVIVSSAAALGTAIRGADASLGQVAVGTLGGGLVVVPSGPDAVTVAAAPGDQITAVRLGLASPRPAIAADPSGAPGATLSLARCTVLGSVAVEAIGLVTDSIVTGAIVCERRQIGCLQHSWVAPGSLTPRRHATVSAPAPSFVSRHYATPGYCRLRRAGATALVRGASDGFEIGALARLRQTQRDDNLRHAIAEFLRFGLEAGVLDGT